MTTSAADSSGSVGTGTGPSPAARFIWLVALAVLALVADWFAPVVFASHSLVLGLVFYWVALRVNGPLPALIVLTTVIATLWLKWGQPFSALLIALEGLAVGMAWRRGRNPLLSDLGFWLFVGTPLSWFLYRQVLPIPHPSFEQALVVQPLNGLLATWLAYLVLDQLPAGGAGAFGRADRDFRGVLLRRYIAFGTLPVLVASLFAVRSFESRALEEANHGLRLAALNLAGEMTRHVDEAAAQMEVAAARQRAPGWKADPAALERTLDTLYARSGLFTSILAADAEGRVIAGSPSARLRAVVGETPAQPVTDREYFTVPMSSGRIHVSGVFRGRRFGTDLLIAASAPVLDDGGRPAGILQGAILVSSLGDILSRGTAGAGTRYLLSDGSLKVIASEGFAEAPLAPLAGTPLARLISAARARPSRVTADSDGARVSYLSTSVSLPGLGWTLTLQREWSDVLRPVMGAYVWSLFVAVSTVLFASFFATWSLRDFLRAWRDLIAFSRAPAARAEALRESARLDLPLEFTEMIRNLGEMARRLEAEGHAREELLARLEVRVKERTAQLEDALRLARQADRTKGVFLATVTHELRTPLTAIITGVKLLRMSPEPRTEPEARTLATLDHASRALMNVISDVLDYSRLEAGAVRAEVVPFKPAAVVAEVVSILDPEVERARLELRTFAEHPAALEWRSDVQRVKQVLLNLAGNALKFTPAGRVEIMTWTTDEPRRLWFAVTDTGPGIPAGRLESVFEPFVQLETNRVQSAAGTGLGLSISRRLVELMGGKIRAVDTGGRGARFEFWLPEEPASAEPPAGPPKVQ